MNKPRVKIGFADLSVEPEVIQLFENSFLKMINTFADVEICDDPDFLICGYYGTEHWNYDCVKIYYALEELEPDFNIFDYAIGLSEMKFHDRYIFSPYYLSARFREHTLSAMKKHERSEEYFKGKRKFCNFVYSNSFADKFREESFHALNKYKHVDSAGKFLNNMGSDQIAGERFSGSWEERKIAFMQDYRFTIAFGNAQKFDYTDEKIFDAWSAGTIPIFWGDPKLKERFNPKAFIDCCDCTSAEEVVARVKEVEEDDDKYLAMQKEPIVKSDTDWYNYIIDNQAEKDLTEFLKNILLQDPKVAKRVSNGISVKSYRRNMKTLSKMKENFFYRLYRKFSVPNK